MYKLHELSYDGGLVFQKRFEPWLTLWKDQLAFVVSAKSIIFFDRWAIRPLLARSQMILQDYFFIHGSAVEGQDYEDIMHFIEHGGYGAVWTISKGSDEQMVSFLRCWSRVEPWSAGDFRAEEIAKLSEVHFGVSSVHSQLFFAFTAGDECIDGMMVTTSSFPVAYSGPSQAGPPI